MAVTQPQKEQLVCTSAAPWQTAVANTTLKLTMTPDTASSATVLKASQSRWDRTKNLLFPRAMEESLQYTITLAVRKQTLQTATSFQFRFVNLASGRSVNPDSRAIVTVANIAGLNIVQLGTDAAEYTFSGLLLPVTAETMTKGWELQFQANGTCSVMMTNLKVVLLG